MIRALGHLPIRQRRVLLAGAAVLGALLLWLGVWQPLDQRRDRLRQQVTDTAEQLAQFRLGLAQGQAGNDAWRAPGSLLSRVDAEARALGVLPHLNTLEPQGTDAVRLQLRDVPFDALANWLERLSTQGVGVDELSLQRAGEPGRVDATLLLRDTGP